MFVIVGSVVLKFILNMPLIIMFETAGAILSTAIALTFAIVCNFFILKNMRVSNLTRRLSMYVKFYYIAL